MVATSPTCERLPGIFFFEEEEENGGLGLFLFYLCLFSFFSSFSFFFLSPRTGRCLAGLLVEGNHIHASHPSNHSPEFKEQHFEGGLGEELGEDIDGGHIDETSGSEWNDPRHHLAVRVSPTENESKECTKESAHGREDLGHNSLLLGKARLDQDGEVSNLVWNLVKKHSNCSGNSELMMGGKC